MDTKRPAHLSLPSGKLSKGQQDRCSSCRLGRRPNTPGQEIRLTMRLKACALVHYGYSRHFGCWFVL